MLPDSNILKMSASTPGIGSNRAAWFGVVYGFALEGLVRLAGILQSHCHRGVTIS